MEKGKVESLTRERNLRYLKTIDEICRKDPMGLAIPMDIEEKMGLEPEVAQVMMKRLRYMGLLESPHRGCYRLADDGRKMMRESRD